MTPNEYQMEALRTEGPVGLSRFIMFGRNNGKSQLTQKQLNDLHNTDRLINGLMGLNGEAGEAIDILKKHLFQGHDLDREHLAKELGDVAWYLAVSADAVGYSLEDIFQMNNDKLRARYPDGFEAGRSVNRSDTDV